MLTSVTIENFRCLKSVSAPLRPLTVLVGSNDSGKSSFLAALQYGVMGIGFQPLDHWKYDPQSVISLSLSTPDGTSTRSSARSATGPEILAAQRPLALFHLNAPAVPMESAGQGEQLPVIAWNGDGVAALLDYLLRTDRERFFGVIKTLRNLVPGLEDIIIGTPNAASRRVDLVLEHGFRAFGQVVSSGVRLLLVFVALAYHPVPYKILLVEEPETGVHPERLADLMCLLREISTGAHGSASQVILTTHSPYLLDLVNLDTDQVLVFRREKDGACKAEPADRARLKVFLDEFKLGEVWYNQGEAGLVAKRS